MDLELPSIWQSSDTNAKGIFFFFHENEVILDMTKEILKIYMYGFF